MAAVDTDAEQLKALRSSDCRCRPLHGRHGERGETDQEIDAHGAVSVEREHRDQDRQAELGAAKTNQVAQDHNPCTSKRRREWSAVWVKAFGCYHGSHSVGEDRSIADARHARPGRDTGYCRAGDDQRRVVVAD